MGPKTLAGCLLIAALVSAVGAAPPSGATPPGSAIIAQAKCKVPRQPCLAPIQSWYAYDGYGVGDTRLLKAKVGPKTVIGEAISTKPLAKYQITKRLFSWHSVGNTTIVAVFLVRGLGSHATYQRLRSGSHSGHAVLTAGFIPPELLLEGSR
jgi:hypothetical protein